ncbi:MAG: hypothetical protein IJR49_03105 [Treponema sp.]|nr:hypothetical protein [Treponema sp.]
MQKKKIEELKKQLEENLANEREVSKIELSKKENESQESKKNTNEQRLEKTNKNTQKTESILEQVRLYKNDFTSLFVSNQNDKTSALYEKELVSNGINALLSGTILSYEGYISLTVSLVIYPGAKLAGTVTDVDSVSNVHILASRVARSLLPFISNSLPVELVINIEPKEAQDNITFSLDDIVHKSIPENIVVQSGVHSLSFSSPGFQSIGTTYSFSGSKKFLISVNMSSISDSSFYLRLKNHQDGNIYVSGDSGVKISDDNPIAKITINNQQVLGMFISKEGLPAPFYIDQKLLTSNANLSVNVKTFNRDEYIDKRRRRMYTSYTALVISLMGTFFTYGNVNAASSATVNNWKIANYACIGISSACGAWLIYELVRYLIAADSVLPAKAKKLDANKIEYNIVSSTSSDSNNSNITNSDSILNDSQLNEPIE